MRRPLLVILLLSLWACGDDDGAADLGVDAGLDFGMDEEDAFTPSSDAGPPDAYVIPPGELLVEPIDPPLTVPAGTTFATFEYGPGSAQVMDAFLQLDATEPTPVVIYVHGGGFTGGSRTEAYEGARATELVTFLEAGVAYVSIDYSLLVAGSEEEGLRKVLRDVRRALQWVRYFSEPLNVDPEPVALIGDSGGGGIGLLIGLRDDMADASSDEPIARESTRVSVVAVSGTQATYDVLRWPPDVFNPTYDVSAEDFVGQPPIAAQILTVYGLPLTWTSMPDRIAEELETPELEAYRAEVDMLAWMSADDPPFHARNDAANLPPDNMDFDLLEHPLHVQALADRAAEVELEATAEAPALDLGGDVDPTQFVLDELLP
jgi:para-nitrobenzyl esterase